MSEYRTLVTALTVLPEGATDMGSDHATVVEAVDSGGGAYVLVRQGAQCSGRRGVAIDTQNCDAIKHAVDAMITLCAELNNAEFKGEGGANK